MLSKMIEDGAREMEIYLPDGAAEKMQVYWERVLETNRTLNLTRIVEERAVCNLHFLDSLAPLQFGFQMIKEGARVLDVGTGAGFPGIPLAIARPDLCMTLIDARRKRVDFIEEAKKDVCPHVRVSHKRVEDVDGKFDVVMARAVASGVDLVGLIGNVVDRGGYAVFWKGPAVFDELEEIKKISFQKNLKLLTPINYIIPNDSSKRTLIVLEK